MLKPALIALLLLAVLAPGASASPDDVVIEISGVIAVEQSGTPGAGDPGVTLIRPADSTFVASSEWGIGGFPELSPDGRELATAFEGCVWFTHVLVTTVPDFTASKCVFGSPLKAREHTWRPDGEYLGFIGETGQGSARQWDVYTMKADETNVQRITTDGAFKSAPVWRADGRIAFIEDGDVHSVGGTAVMGTRSQRETNGLGANAIDYIDLGFGPSSLAYVSRPNTFNVPDRLFVSGRAVLTRPAGTLRGVAWQPGQTPNHLVVAVQNGGDSELLVITLSGEIKRRLPVNRPANPDWRRDAFADTAGGGGGGGAGGGDPVGATPRDPVGTPPRSPREEPRSSAGKARADRRGRVPLALTCPAPVACRYRVSGRATAGRSARVALPVRRFRVAAGRTRRVRYRLPRTARKLLRKRGRLQVRFTITGPQPGVHTLTVRRR